MTVDGSALSAWDTIEGIPDALENQWLFGHEATLDFLASQYASGKMHHAWLLSGPRGIGKATLASRFAAHVFRHPLPMSAPQRYVKPGPDDREERQVSRSAHPNHLHLRRPFDPRTGKWRQEITVAEIRRSIAFFGNTAGQAGWRVAVVDTADDLNASAANALLKVLEEPPPKTLFLILANAPKMLATIRSRCQRLVLRPLADDVVAQALTALGLAKSASNADMQLVARLAQGSVRRAIVLVGNNGLALYRSFLAITANRKGLDWEKVNNLASELSPVSANERYRLLLGMALDYVARRIRSEPEPSDYTALPDRQIREAGPAGLAAWVEVWDSTIKGAQLQDEWNLDRKQVILNLFAAIHKAA